MALNPRLKPLKLMESNTLLETNVRPIGAMHMDTLLYIQYLKEEFQEFISQTEKTHTSLEPPMKPSKKNLSNFHNSVQA